MDTDRDFIQESRVKVLGLSAPDFERWLLEEGLTTQQELAIHPERISELMSVDENWEKYESDREERYLNMIQDQRARWAYL